VTARIFASQGFMASVTQCSCSVGYMSNRQFTWQPPFMLLDRSDFLAHQRRKADASMASSLRKRGSILKNSFAGRGGAAKRRNNLAKAQSRRQHGVVLAKARIHLKK